MRSKAAGSGKQLPDRLHAAVCGSGLLSKDLFGALAHGFCGVGVLEQYDQGCGEVFFCRDAEGVVRQQVFGDGAEVGVVGAHDDGDAELCRLKRIVSSGGDQAAAHKGHRGERVDRGQLADGVEQNDLAWT